VSEAATRDRLRHHVVYDRIAPSYNQRFVSNDMQSVGAALQDLARELGAERVLEVGCGTGRWLADLSRESHHVSGLDLSLGMLQQAGKREREFDLVQGRAGVIPLPDAAFDLVYCVNAIHHFDTPQTFIREALRLLKPGGALAVVGSDPHDDHRGWYVYDYFPGTLETDLERFPSWGTVLDWMVGAGFQRVEWRLVQQIRDDKIGPEVLDDPFLQRNACSQLALLTDQEYGAGLRRIETKLREAAGAGDTVGFPVDIRLAALVGQSPTDEHRVRTR
jgi:ubiquinone/menaquinone biosynthesis C-methylase UbiE